MLGQSEISFYSVLMYKNYQLDLIVDRNNLDAFQDRSDHANVKIRKRLFCKGFRSRRSLLMERRFLGQHSVVIVGQCCNHSQQ